jgi:hypothetical protein
VAAPKQRHALGALFILLAAGFAGVAYAAGQGRAWPVAVAAAVLAVWLAGMAVRLLTRSR